MPEIHQPQFSNEIIKKAYYRLGGAAPQLVQNREVLECHIIFIHCTSQEPIDPNIPNTADRAWDIPIEGFEL